MKEQMHTPGPFAWEQEKFCEPKYGNLLASNGTAVIDLSCSECGGGKVENPADRALFAAAPDLLAACDAVAALEDDTDNHIAWHTAFDMARAAIAKAKAQ